MHGFLRKRERKELLRELKRESYARYSDRIKTILLLDQGKSYSEISEFLFLTDRTIRNYSNSYILGGLDQLITDDYKGCLSFLDTGSQKELKEFLSKNLLRTITQVCCHIKKEYKVSYTKSGARDLLKRLGFVYKKPKLIPGKANKQEQEEFLVKLKKLKNSVNPLYFADGVHPQHNTYIDYGWILKGKDFELKSNTKRYRVNINGAINAEDPEDVLIDSSNTVNAQSTIKLLKKIEAKNPDAKRINVVVDNARYYRCKLVSKYLITSRVRLIFLPPYSPNLNLIERLWRVMNRNVLYNIYYERLEDFRKAILQFFRRIKKYRKDVQNILNFKFRIIGV